MAATSSDYAALAEVFTDWWRGLQSLNKNGEEILISGTPKSPDRQALAELRRIGIVDEEGIPRVDVARAISVPAFGKLIAAIRVNDVISGTVRSWASGDDPKLAPFVIAATTLARVRQDAVSESIDLTKRGSTAWLLGAPRSDGANDPNYAEPRFKRLLRCRDDWPDLMGQARRVGAILERKAPIGDLGASLVLWNYEPRIRRDWAFQYYQKNFDPADDALAAPSTTQSI